MRIIWPGVWVARSHALSAIAALTLQTLRGHLKICVLDCWVVASDGAV